MSQSEAGVVYRFDQWQLGTIFKDAKIRKQILVMTISGNYFQKNVLGNSACFLTKHIIISYKAHFYCLFQQCVIWAQLQAGFDSNENISSGTTVWFSGLAKRSISRRLKTIKSNVFWSQFNVCFIISNA